MLVTEKYGLSSSLCAAAVSKEEPRGPPNPCSRKGVSLKKMCSVASQNVNFYTILVQYFAKVKSLAVGCYSAVEAHFGFLRQSEVGSSLCSAGHSSQPHQQDILSFILEFDAAPFLRGLLLHSKGLIGL